MKIKRHQSLQSFIRILVMFFSLSLVFVSGSFSTDAKIEDISFYSAQVVKNNTISKKTLSLIVRSNDKSGSLPNLDSEFHNLYGAFKERVITFASTINADKTMNLRIGDDTSVVSENVSMLYFGAVGSIKYPVTHPTHYKHIMLPIELMFEDNRSSYDVNRFIINISQHHANKLLANKGLTPQPDGNYLKKQYESLIRTECKLTNDNNDTIDVCINNIYLQQNYYYEGLNETIKDFVMISYFIPWDLRNHLENCYFLTDSAYQNSYFMKYINDVYGINKYDIYINKNNTFGNIDEEKIISFNSIIISSTNWVSVFLLVLSIVLSGIMAISLLLLNEYRFRNTIFELLFLPIPYFIFFVAFHLTKNLFIFSSFSCAAHLFIILVYLSAFLLFMFLKKIRKKQLIDNRGLSCEIFI